MELWIRSQDREKLFLVKELYVFSNEHMTNKTYKIVNDYNENLGIYKTKERALEVLDEIQKYINNECKFLEREQHTSMGTYINKEQMRVYEIPKE